jgi:hypothetical protein
MSKVNTFETDVLELVFNNAPLTGLGDGSGLQASTPAGSLYVHLYTVAPTESTPGTVCSYGGYSQVAVARSSAGWTVSGNNVSNTSAITFPTCTSGTETAVAVGVCFVTSSTTILYYANLDSSLSISVGVQPQFLAGELDINEG